MLIKSLFLIFSTLAFVSGQNPSTKNGSLCDENNKVGGSSLYRYHSGTQKCYKVGEKGICGQNMIFYAHPTDSKLGVCDCDIKLRCNKPLIYWPLSDQCYFAYEKGPCSDEDWLVLDRFHEPTCQRNPCSHSQNSSTLVGDEKEKPSNYWVFLSRKGVCAQMETRDQGYCPDPNEFLIIDGMSDSIEPKCSLVKYSCQLPQTQIINGHQNQIVSLFCRPGQKWSSSEHCTGTWRKNRILGKSFKKSRRSGRSRGHGRHNRQFKNHFNRNYYDENENGNELSGSAVERRGKGRHYTRS